MKTELEIKIDEMRASLNELAERVRLHAVAEAFLRCDHNPREGDYFLLDDLMPTRLQNVGSDGRWTYFDGHSTIEPYRVPEPGEYNRLYTIAEVAEILAKAVKAARRYVKADPAPIYDEIFEEGVMALDRDGGHEHAVFPPESVSDE